MDIINVVNTVLCHYELMTASGISNNKAHVMNISHGDASVQKNTFKLINENVGKLNGVYIYHNKDEVYYVGKAKGLHRRMKCHFKESVFDESHWKDGRKGIAGDKWKGVYPAYFRDYLKDVELTITWVEIKEEELRKSVETLLNFKLKPRFLEFQSTFKS